MLKTEEYLLEKIEMAQAAIEEATNDEAREKHRQKVKYYLEELAEKDAREDIVQRFDLLLDRIR